MTPLVVEAIYENGVLKPARPLPLKEQEKVRIVIESELSCAERTAGMLQWTGDPEILRRIAQDPEFGILEAYDHEELSRFIRPSGNPSSESAEQAHH